jgi:biotin-dependent carboxylase-like uncharacterized protein
MINQIFRVEQAGLLSTFQDLGRFGYGSFGVPAAGAMDPYSHRLANILVGNPEHEATLEMTFLGPTLTVLNTSRVAVVGGDLGADLNGVVMPTCVAFEVRVGDVLRFAGGKGVRSYLAVAGGWDLPVVMGSRSTYLRAALGGLGGAALKKGQILGAQTPIENPNWFGTLPKKYWPLNPQDSKTIRILWGPQDDYFDEGQKRKLTSQSWKVGKDSDRMGYRLEGEALQHLDKKEIVSDGVCQGAIQVPGHGQPIVLLADAQTTGGYPKIATIISADLGRLAHFKASDTLNFEVVSYDEAINALKQQISVLQEVRQFVDSQQPSISKFYNIKIRGLEFQVRVDEV